MGTSDSKEEAILPELKDMKIIKQEENYTIYEKGTLQLELWLITTTEQNCKDDETLINQIKVQQYSGLTNIINYKLEQKDKWYSFQANKYFCVLIEHPKYSLREYLSKKKSNFCFEQQQLVDLTIQILSAQLALGKHSQYLGFDNIFTNDGTRWMLKPFLPNQSYYSYYKKTHDASNGFPAPEEFNSKVSDTTRVQIFGFGMILLELILNKQNADIYQNGNFNAKLLEERTKELQQHKRFYSEKLINLITDMIDFNLTHRPNYSLLSNDFQNSKIKCDLYNELNKTPLPDKFWPTSPDSFINLQKAAQTQIQEVQSYIEITIEEMKRQSEKKIKNCSNQRYEQQDGTTYIGDIKDNQYHGSGKLFQKDGEKLYEGDFFEGKYHGFGIEYFRQNKATEKSLDYNDLREIFKFAEVYEGKFEEGIKIGEGKVVLFNGESFSGGFYNNLPHGIGAYKYKQGDNYSGQWKNGILDQFYCMTNSQKNLQSFHPQQQTHVQDNVSMNLMPPPIEGNQYQGDPMLSSANLKLSLYLFKKQNDFKIRDSLELYKNKTERQDDEGKKIVCYQGEFIGNKLTGKGAQYSKNNVELYIGEFQQGKYHNFGKLINENQNNECTIDIKDFRKLLQNNGWKNYEGQFLNGKKNGKGQLILVDMSLFQGSFSNDQVDGEGVWQRKNKEEVVAIWRDGQLERILKGSI